MIRAKLALAAAGIIMLAATAHAGTCETTKNRALITRFAELLYAKHQVAAAFNAYVAPDYIQHNPGLTDGRNAAIEALAPMFAKPRSRFEVKQILVDCDLAALHLLGQEDPQHPAAAVVDIYRIEHGKIVEHWDVIQVIPCESKNPHPMF